MLMPYKFSLFELLMIPHINVLVPSHHLIYLYMIETTRLKKEHYLMRQDNKIYTFFIKLFLKYRTRQIKATETYIRSYLYILQHLLTINRINNTPPTTGKPCHLQKHYTVNIDMEINTQTTNSLSNTGSPDN